MKHRCIVIIYESPFSSFVNKLNTWARLRWSGFLQNKFQSYHSAFITILMQQVFTSLHSIPYNYYSRTQLAWRDSQQQAPPLSPPRSSIKPQATYVIWAISVPFIQFLHFRPISYEESTDMPGIKCYLNYTNNLHMRSRRQQITHESLQST